MAQSGIPARTGGRPAAADMQVTEVAAALTRPDTSHDPWGHAVEQAPGVWVVGTEPNVGKIPSSSVPDEAVAKPAPDYEPATAQIPRGSAGILAARASSPAVPTPQGPAPGGAAPEPGGSGSPVAAPDREVSVPEPAEVREYAMASAAPAPAPTPAAAPALQPAPATSASAAQARQSLYQRLSNSPEAEAGRAKAPARVAAATYVQDIPSADDETIEESGIFGRAAVERILGGKLIEERSPDGAPIVPRF
ncbi:MAG: hypothetical protein NVSMB43_18610 [Pseudarthrobacter sp.]